MRVFPESSSLFAPDKMSLLPYHSAATSPLLPGFNRNKLASHEFPLERAADRWCKTLGSVVMFFVSHFHPPLARSLARGFWGDSEIYAFRAFGLVALRATVRFGRLERAT